MLQTAAVNQRVVGAAEGPFVPRVQDQSDGWTACAVETDTRQDIRQGQLRSSNPETLILHSLTGVVRFSDKRCV